jgi:glutamine cyclotransferase
LRFIDPDSFRGYQTIPVTAEGKPVNELNELEFVQGEIFASIWHDQRIVTINPESGVVTLGSIALVCCRRRGD